MNSLIAWTSFGFILGSIPFSFLLVHFWVHRDIRTVGDGNPGATNAWKAGGWPVGLSAVALDISKGFAPLYLARRMAGLEGWALLPVALAPILGHALQPWLKFHGGKALATSGGAWIAWIGLRTLPIYASLTLPALALQVEHAWAAFAGMFALLGYTLWFVESPPLTAFACINLCIIAWTHRRELRHAPRLRAWLANRLSRRNA
ncbi:MAG: hypothetical protein D6770_03315 [Anaerolineae bacterium]|nr:MAG: hypothetical protein D6770_03315 [Anaerolineae bacterium]